MIFTIPTTVKESALYPDRLGCYVSSPIKKNSIIFEWKQQMGLIELTSTQFKEVLFLIKGLPGEEKKKRLLQISELFVFDKNNRILPISNIAYLNSHDSNYNVQDINGIIYATRDINNNEELISNVCKIVEWK